MTAEPTFADFWAVYPRRVGRGAAEKSWEKVTKRMKIAPSVIVEGAKRYAAAKRGTDPQFIAHGGTWLNQQRWLDEPDTMQEPEQETAVDPAAAAWVQQNKTAHALRNRIIERTREHHQHRIEEAARRLDATEQEFWSCLTPGVDGIAYRAWDAAIADIFRGNTAPSYLPIDKRHWLSARDRLLTRRRCVAGPAFSRLPTFSRVQADENDAIEQASQLTVEDKADEYAENF
jgi:hypothetical protein